MELLVLNMILVWLLWKQTDANQCDATPYQVPGHVLLHHVIQSFHGTSSAVSCQDKCRDNLSCHSINWYRKTALCQLNSGTHLSYPEGLVPDSTGSYMLYSPHPMVTCSNRLCSHGDICVMEKDGIRYRCLLVSMAMYALGMQDKRIQDSQITASSTHRNDADYKPNRARLHSTLIAGSWCADNLVAGEYLQIDLKKILLITKVATQGRYGILQWVTKYYLDYSQDGNNWESYKYGGTVQHFQGNKDSNSVVANKLPSPIQASFIRFVVLEWYIYIALRVELYGCDIP